MTSTDSITTAPAAAPKEGKGRKIAVIAGVGATLLIGVLMGFKAELSDRNSIWTKV